MTMIVDLISDPQTRKVWVAEVKTPIQDKEFIGVFNKDKFLFKRIDNSPVNNIFNIQAISIHSYNTVKRLDMTFDAMPENELMDSMKQFTISKLTR